MKVLVVGATGRTGRLVIEQALARGHDVTALGRGVGALSVRGGLTAVHGDPLSAKDLATVLPGHDAVISALGRRTRSDTTVLRDGGAAMVEAMHRGRVRRYILVSQGLHFASSSPLVWILRRVLASALEDSGAMERMVAASELEWTIVRAPRLREGGVARGYRLEIGKLPKGPLSMERADLAACLLDESESGAHARAVVGVTSR